MSALMLLFEKWSSLAGKDFFLFKVDHYSESDGVKDNKQECTICVSLVKNGG